MIEVVALAGSALFQDQGRAHLASGVPASGAFDRTAHAVGTALVGGDPREACLEVVGRVVLRAGTRMVAAVTGQGLAWIDGRPAPLWTAVEVAAGALLELEAQGRLYLAVAGGLRPEPVLGSRSTSVLDGLGPPPVRVGQRIATSRFPVADTVGDVATVPLVGGPVRVVAGPHLALERTMVEVRDTSRIGVRLRPDARIGVGHVAGRELLSVGVLPGALQVLPAGDWMLLGPDAGTMGGYPIAGVVATADLSRWAHVAPGDRLELLPVTGPPATVEPVILRIGQLG